MCAVFEDLDGYLGLIIVVYIDVNAKLKILSSITCFYYCIECLWQNSNLVMIFNATEK